MLRTITSLSFLYAVVIGILLLYALLYYRDFKRGVFRRRFPLVFTLVSIAGVFFLWMNIHAPLSLKTFTNTDHYFIRHNGFVASKELRLGLADTAVNPGQSYNEFLFTKSNGLLSVKVNYSEEPLYMRAEEGHTILSRNFPAEQHGIRLRNSKWALKLEVPQEGKFVLQIGDATISRELDIRKGISAWDLFRSNEQFLLSPFYNDPQLQGALQHTLLIRDDVARKSAGALKFFFSGKVLQYCTPAYDNTSLTLADLAFTHIVPDKANIAWGIGFLENNRNQFEFAYLGKDSFSLKNKYPVSYPLTEENRNDWQTHQVNKFLVSSPGDMQQVPGIFREGFLFGGYGTSADTRFQPLLLTYQKGARNDEPGLQVSYLQQPSRKISLEGNLLRIPAGNNGVAWEFSVVNSYHWDFNGFSLTPTLWESLLFGSLIFYFVLVLLSSIVQSPQRFSWIGQLLASVVFILLCTRYFLYWRYKSFPPFEGMDLPSQQQLNSFGNFGIILAATILLAFVFGYPFLKYAYHRLRSAIARLSGKRYYPKYSSEQNTSWINKLENRDSRWLQKLYFGSWFLLLVVSGALAAVKNFDAATCRHIAIAFVIIYFGYLFISYRFSPLVAGQERSWWRIRTGRTSDLLINNPVKILLSISLLALFVFIDIGFAIVFLNFLLFNEAFLCINYAIGGLSAGSRRNAALFGSLGTGYILFFVLNLLYAPYIFRFLLELPQAVYVIGYLFFAISIAYVIARLLFHFPAKKRKMVVLGTAAVFFLIAFFFFPKERILDKAAMTKYRIDVLTTTVDEAITGAYEEGKTYEPVIRAAQNQWFINTFIDEENNPGVKTPGFNLLAHAPQNKGAKYNAQATDLVASRYLLGEHGRMAVLLYVLLLLIPAVLLAYFYKLYPDFTNRTNPDYPAVTAGFSVLNYLLITALMVILAATGRYIFFGQDLPFGSILSKQSILFPALLVGLALWLFRNVAPENYGNKRKFVPGAVVFGLLAVMLFIVKPGFNRQREFGVANLATDMDNYMQQTVQPLLDYVDTATATRRLPIARKDKLFTDSLRQMMASGFNAGGNRFFESELKAYTNAGLTRHLDQRRLMYLDLHTGRPQIAINRNYFRVEAPPHLQQLWTGNVYGDSLTRNISIWHPGKATIQTVRVSAYDSLRNIQLDDTWMLSGGWNAKEEITDRVFIVNKSNRAQQVDGNGTLHPGDSLQLNNPSRLRIIDTAGKETIIAVEPDSFMRNYYVNGSRFYVYPLGERFNWARNFAEAISPGYKQDRRSENAFVSLDYELMDSLTLLISNMMNSDVTYLNDAEYGITIADGNGRIIAIPDYIKGFVRPNPNDKALFTRLVSGDNGFTAQSILRKQVGNLNLLRMNPGPGSTLKPIVFSAIASQMPFEWEKFASEGFTEKQHFYGGMKVPEYDFEKNNGRIGTINDYLKYSDNYYHANLLLLGSYEKQNIQQLLNTKFVKQKPGEGLRWPWFTYNGSHYWMDGFKNWPGYENGKADFGGDSSFTSIGLLSNFGIYTKIPRSGFTLFENQYDTLLFGNSARNSGFILPETPVFDQHGAQVDHRIAYDLFTTCFRGHVKGSSQVMIPPISMAEAFGRLASQSRQFALTLNPTGESGPFQPFYVDNSIAYNQYLEIIRTNVFGGMRDVLFGGTAGRLGAQLKNAAPYYYYGKTGTTGDDEKKDSKSKLFSLVISKKDISAPGFTFRQNRFYTIYFTSQNGPAKQNEEFQAAVIRLLESSKKFRHYMKG